MNAKKVLSDTNKLVILIVPLVQLMVQTIM